jgi:hypothetical protein
MRPTSNEKERPSVHGQKSNGSIEREQKEREQLVKTQDASMIGEMSMTMTTSKKLHAMIREGTRGEPGYALGYGVRVGYWPCLCAPYIQIAFHAGGLRSGSDCRHTRTAPILAILNTTLTNSYVST